LESPNVSKNIVRPPKDKKERKRKKNGRRKVCHTIPFSTHQQSGQGTRESFHQTQKSIITKTRNLLEHKVKETLTEVKMSVMRKRTVETDKKKTYQRADRVTVLGLVCEKMTVSGTRSTGTGGQT
jgi:hypothetical protein